MGFSFAPSLSPNPTCSQIHSKSQHSPNLENHVKQKEESMLVRHTENPQEGPKWQVEKEGTSKRLLPCLLRYLVTVQCRKETNRQSLRDTYAVSSRSQRKMTEMFLLTMHMPPTSKNRLCFCVRFAYTCYYMYVEGSHICKSFCPELENLGWCSGSPCKYKEIRINLSYQEGGTKQTVQFLKSLAALPENQGLIAFPNMANHNHL